jgi:hypothetical protein
MVIRHEIFLTQSLILQSALLRIPFRLGMVLHICNPSSWEAKAGGLDVGGSLDYVARPCLKKTQKQKRIPFIFCITKPQFEYFRSRVISLYL